MKLEIDKQYFSNFPAILRSNIPYRRESRFLYNHKYGPAVYKSIIVSEILEEATLFLKLR